MAGNQDLEFVKNVLERVRTWHTGERQQLIHEALHKLDPSWQEPAPKPVFSERDVARSQAAQDGQTVEVPTVETPEKPSAAPSRSGTPGAPSPAPGGSSDAPPVS